MSALFDFTSLLVVLLLLICSCAFLRAWSLKRDASGAETSMLDGDKKGLRGLAWKFARIGERLSPYVAFACIAMAFEILLF